MPIQNYDRAIKSLRVKEARQKEALQATQEMIIALGAVSSSPSSPAKN